MRQHILGTRARRLAAAVLAIGTLSSVPFAWPQEETEHAGHNMSHDGPMDAETMAALREIIPPFRAMSDDEIMEIMRMMPPDYNVYVSDKSLHGDVGVLVVTHGFGEAGDKVFVDALGSVAAEYPTAVGFGMTMMSAEHLQAGVDDLVAAGAKTVVVVPAAQSEFDTGIRQWEYVFGERSEPAYLPTALVSSEAVTIVAPTLSDHPLVSAILLDHAREISTDEADEVVIVIGHGPAGNEDNALELAMMQSHVDYLTANSSFADVHAINLQDDSGPEIRGANVAKFRAMAEEAAAQGHTVLIVGFLIGTAGIQPKIERDLAGLDFRFNAKGMSEHPNFAAWVLAMVADAAGE